MFAFVLAELRLAWWNLFEHKRRTLTLALALACVSGSYGLLASLFEGIRQSTLDATTTLATGHLNLTGYRKSASGHTTVVLSDPEALSQLVRRAVPETARIVTRGRGWGRIVSDDGVALTAGITGLDFESEPAFQQAQKAARGKPAELVRPNTILLFESQADTLGVGVGDDVTVATVLAGGATNTIDCRVVAIAPDQGALSKLSTYISNTSFRDLYNLAPAAAGTLQLTLSPGSVDMVDALAARVRHALTQAGYRVMEPDGQPSYARLERAAREDWTGDMVDVTTWSEELPTVMWSLQTLQGLIVLLLLVMSAVALAGVANALFVAVRERTREIGTLRALGARRSTIARLFVMEAALLGALAGTGGAVAGMLLSLLLDAAGLSMPAGLRNLLVSSDLRLIVQPRTIMNEVVLLTLTTSAAACVPALRAAQRKPSAAMTHYT